MQYDPRIRRLHVATLICFLSTFAYLFWSELAHGAEPLSSAMGRLAVYHEDRDNPDKAAHLQALASAIEKASDARPKGVSRKDWQALLVTVGYWESTFSLRIHAGNCKPKECDAGRARSPWQMHRNVFNAPVWDQMFGLEHVELQAKTASEMLTRSYWQCSRSGQHWLSGTINAFAGKRCGDIGWDGMGKRVQTYYQVRNRL